MRYPQVLKYVGKLIYERGLSCYKEKKIRTYNRNGNSITASVSGSLNNEYSVTIELDHNGEVIEADCSCPYWKRCKHVAAVLIHTFNELTGKTDEENPVESLMLKGKTEKVIPLDFSLKPSQELVVNLRFIEEVAFPKKIDDGKDWQLVFKLKKNVDENKSHSGWNISPGIRFRKKDGKPGIVYNFKKNKIVACSAFEENIINKLLSKPGRKDDFIHFLEIFVEHEEIPLVMHHHYEHVEVNRYEIQKTELDFEIQEIRKDSVLFSPVVTFHYEDDRYVIMTKEECVPLKDGIYFAIIAHDGTLLYCKSHDIYDAIITYLLTNQRLYTPSDIKAIGDFINKTVSDAITITFTSKRVNLEGHTPQPVIEVQPYLRHTLTLTVLFDYSGNIIEYSSDDGFIIGSMKGNDITVFRKKRTTERDIIAYVKTLFKQYIADDILIKKAGEFRLAIDVHTFLSRFGPVLVDEGYTIRIGREKKIKRGGGTFHFSVTSGIDWFDISLLYTDEEGHTQTVTLKKEDINQGLVRTSDSYILLDKSNFERVKLLLEECDVEKGSLRFSKLNFSVIDTLYNEIAVTDDKEISRYRAIYDKLKNITTIDEYPLPQHFHCTLRKYQQAGYNWLCFLKDIHINGCLADDMGLGKTVQTLALLQRLKENYELGRCLIVVPVTTLANWESEIERFTPGLSCIRHAGQSRATSMEDLEVYDLVLVSYHTLRNDIELFNTREFHYLILDESQNIKNANTRTFKAVRTIKAGHRLSLTGTPVENNTLELWAQMDVLNPGIFGSLNSFKRRYTRPIEEYEDSNVSMELKKRIFPFLLRRKKEDVIRDLPKKEIIYRYVEMGALQMEIYLEVNNVYRDKINSTIDRKGVKKSAIEILEALLRLRQMSLFPFLVSEKYSSVESCKFELFKEMLEEILEEKHKVLVFSQFVQVLKQLEDYVSGLGIEYSYLDGTTKKRKTQIDKFQKDTGVQVFLLSLKAGGIGINLTAADYVILFDPWWNPAIERQAIDRTHRIGQTNKVIAYKMIVKDSIEEKILELQRKKEKLVGHIITDDTSIFKSFNKDDIMRLFQ
jgi:superfamily II DNA or RNA helicase